MLLWNKCLLFFFVDEFAEDDTGGVEAKMRSARDAPKKKDDIDEEVEGGGGWAGVGEVEEVLVETGRQLIV